MKQPNVSIEITTQFTIEGEEPTTITLAKLEMLDFCTHEPFNTKLQRIIDELKEIYSEYPDGEVTMNTSTTTEYLNV